MIQPFAVQTGKRSGYMTIKGYSVFLMMLRLQDYNRRRGHPSNCYKSTADFENQWQIWAKAA